MAISKKTSRNFRTQLNGAQKKSGICTWRFVFSGIEKVTGQERRFFIELCTINPSLSPNEMLLGYKPRVNITADDLQNVLSGTLSAQKIRSESFVVPSYIVVRAGVLGPGAKQVCDYSAARDVSISTKEFHVETSHAVFTEDKLTGRMDCSPGDIQEHPEYLCDSGIISWELRYEIRKDFTEGYNGKNCIWNAIGGRTVFAGIFSLDGKEYEVIPKKSQGYIDHFIGKDVVYPWIHLSSCNLTSVISGKTLTESTFAVQGIFDNRVSAVVDLEGRIVVFEADKGKRAFESFWDFTQMPEGEGGEKLHWTISLHNKTHVVDIDVFCPAGQMYVRSIEVPEGKRKVLKMLSGGTGSGEIRLYKRIRKNLELIEQAHIAGCVCEYGQLEEPEE